METAKIVKGDVIAVAKRINKKLTDDEIQSILEEYQGWQDSQPSSIWTEVIEDLIYFKINHR